MSAPQEVSQEKTTSKRADLLLFLMRNKLTPSWLKLAALRRLGVPDQIKFQNQLYQKDVTLHLIKARQSYEQVRQVDDVNYLIRRVKDLLAGDQNAYNIWLSDANNRMKDGFAFISPAVIIDMSDRREVPIKTAVTQIFTQIAKAYPDLKINVKTRVEMMLQGIANFPERANSEPYLDYLTPAVRLEVTGSKSDTFENVYLSVAINPDVVKIGSDSLIQYHEKLVSLKRVTEVVDLLSTPQKVIDAVVSLDPGINQVKVDLKDAYSNPRILSAAEVTKVLANLPKNKGSIVDLPTSENVVPTVTYSFGTLRFIPHPDAVKFPKTYVLEFEQSSSYITERRADREDDLAIKSSKLIGILLEGRSDKKPFSIQALESSGEYSDYALKTMLERHRENVATLNFMELRAQVKKDLLSRRSTEAVEWEKRQLENRKTGFTTAREFDGEDFVFRGEVSHGPDHRPNGYNWFVWPVKKD